ncbi:unnamed protein product [Mytilus edulis]|uniref:Uncharacterized protein n=1 Tax=Mytilus edulis TaxID=6550 RepID=A0A8S3UA91_MYTED|nr:unnamed protein product [Mytilus edulis]
MSERKLEKYLKRKLPEITSEKSSTPILISDSKGNYLKTHIETEIDHKIRWYCERGRSTIAGYSWLESNIQRLTDRLDSVHVYVWLGTCDLTPYKRPFISLALPTDNILQTIFDTYDKFITLLAKYPNSHITFLEIPIYSIVEWNKYQKHQQPSSFTPQDELLISQLEKLNCYIKELNTQLATNPSPMLSVDISHNQSRNSKSKKHLTRHNYNFTLYKDVIHPSTK